MPIDHIIKISVDTHEPKDIEIHKDLLLHSVTANLRHTKRRGTSKAQEDIRDMINVLLEVEPKRHMLFVAMDNNLPPLALVRSYSLPFEF